MKFFEIIGRFYISFFVEAGKYINLSKSTFLKSFTVLKRRDLFFNQAFEVGVKSIILIISVAFFTGTVTAYQTGEQMVDLVPLTYLGVSVYKMMVMELGPVLTGVIMAGRYGASIAAEIGTMKVTEQIDALKSMAIEPIEFLAVPRFVAAIIMLPIAVIFANFIGVMGGFLISHIFFDLNFNEFFNEVQNYFDMMDITIGLVKTAVFGGIISTVGIYVGFEARGGAEGVGKATVKAFVLSSVLILIADLVIALIML